MLYPVERNIAAIQRVAAKTRQMETLDNRMDAIIDDFISPFWPFAGRCSEPTLSGFRCRFSLSVVGADYFYTIGDR